MKKILPRRSEAKPDVKEWEEAQATETGFWGTCANTYGEETKQFLYMDRMGFEPYHDGKSPFAYRGDGRSFLDIGGGPISVLLKVVGARQRVVVDPCRYPDWVYARYRAEGIECALVPAEDLAVSGKVDVCLIYNVLQHVRDPGKVIENALGICESLHVFEWVGMPAHPGHPHRLSQADLERWTGLKGTVEAFEGEYECHGTAWFA